MELEPKLLGMTEAARRLAVHYLTLRRWELEGRIRAQRDSSGKRLFLAADIEKLAEERAAQAGRMPMGARSRRVGSPR